MTENENVVVNEVNCEKKCNCICDWTKKFLAIALGTFVGVYFALFTFAYTPIKNAPGGLCKCQVHKMFDKHKMHKCKKGPQNFHGEFAPDKQFKHDIGPQKPIENPMKQPPVENN